MSLRKVVQWGMGRIGHVTVDDEATKGAVVGNNLKWADGNKVLESEILNSVVVQQSGTQSDVAVRYDLDAHKNNVSNPHVVKHAQLSDVSVDQHHAKAHTHDGVDGSGTVVFASIDVTPTTLAGYGITGTKAEFDTAVTDGNIAYAGGAFHDGFSDFVANEHVDLVSGAAVNIDIAGTINTTDKYLAASTTGLIGEFTTAKAGAAGGQLQFRRATGTPSSPAAVALGNVLMQYAAKGYGATGWGNNTVSIHALATEAWTDTAQGSEINFLTTPNGSASNARAMLLTNGGDVQVSKGNLVISTAGKGIDMQGGPTITSGTGTPEGIVTAAIGSLFMRSDGGAGTSLYVKESGTGNTGWIGK